MPYQPGDLLLNKYRIDSFIGSGAFAEVYLATHLELNAPRALKILRRDALGLGSTEYSDFRSRFQLEAQLGARLDHPNLVRVYDFERDGETLILVMEFCPAGSLADLLNRLRQKGERLPLQTVLRTALDLANGLSALHALDAVHRDLKPSNVLFTSQGGAKLADLGLAQIPGGPSLRSQLSTAAPHPGTPGYMSPEQTNITNYLSSASDIYALGCVLFEMLTGRVYVSQRPGTRPGRLRTDTPAWLDELVGKMLSRDPEARPWDGAEAALLLQQGWERARQEEAERLAEAQRLAAEQRAKEEAAALDTERARVQAEQAAQRQVEQRALKIAQYRHEYQAALEGERWQAAEQSLAALAALGEDDARQAAVLRQELEQAQEAARQRKQQQDIQSAEKWRAVARRGLPLGGVILAILIVVGGKWVWSYFSNNPRLQDKQPTATFMQPTLTFALLPNTPTPTVFTEKDRRKMVLVPAGPFLMGSDAGDALAECQKFRSGCQGWWFTNEEPLHTVDLRAFWIDRIEVTNAMYALCVADGACSPPSSMESRTRDDYYNDSYYADFPVIWVSWNDASAYCTWAGRRLPTEAEWEKAARGTDGQYYSWGNQEPTCDLANFWGKDGGNSACEGDTTEVGSYPSGASPYGALDMAGNVWEWVSSLYMPYPYQANYFREDLNASGNRVLRGGSWNYGWYDVRATDRRDSDPAYSRNDIGFRCARSQ